MRHNQKSKSAHCRMVINIDARNVPEIPCPLVPRYPVCLHPRFQLRSRTVAKLTSAVGRMTNKFLNGAHIRRDSCVHRISRTSTSYVFDIDVNRRRCESRQLCPRNVRRQGGDCNTSQISGRNVVRRIIVERSSLPCEIDRAAIERRSAEAAWESTA
jgi:hypothetical protein